MGPWKDFLASQNLSGGGASSSSPAIPYSAVGQSDFTSTPSPLAALKARPIRTLLAGVGVLAVLTLLLAAAGGPGSKTIRKAWPDKSGQGKGWSTDTSQAPWRAPGWRSGEGAGAGGGSVNSALGRWDTHGVDRGVFGGSPAEPDWETDPRTGLVHPPDVNPLKMNGYRRANATFVSLVRNSEKWSIMSSMRGVEDRFNRKFGYPWVFLNDEPFSDDFKDAVSSMTRSKVYFGQIPREHWSYPDWVDLEKAARERKKMEEEQVIYGGSESYRMMCRFNSGFFYRHELLQNFDYYWRVEPGVEYYCDIDRDLFLFVRRSLFATSAWPLTRSCRWRPIKRCTGSPLRSTSTAGPSKRSGTPCASLSSSTPNTWRRTTRSASSSTTSTRAWTRNTTSATSGPTSAPPSALSRSPRSSRSTV